VSQHKGQSNITEYGSIPYSVHGEILCYVFKITTFKFPIIDLVNGISSGKRGNQGVWQYWRHSLYMHG